METEQLPAKLSPTLPHLLKSEKEHFTQCAFYGNLLKDHVLDEKITSDKRYTSVIKDLNQQNLVSDESLFDPTKLSNKALRFEKSDIDCWGVFADEFIKKGDPIIEYIGEIIRKRIVEKREKLYEKEGNNGSYIFRIDDNNYIDATHAGGLARFINHSCEPNCETRMLTFNKKKRVVIFAKRDIMPCEELCYDYQLPYEEFKNAIPCKCGSSKCKGYLNYNPKEDEDKVKNDKEMINNKKIKRKKNTNEQKVKKQQMINDIHLLIPDVKITRSKMKNFLRFNDDEIDSLNLSENEESE